MVVHTQFAAIILLKKKGSIEAPNLSTKSQYKISVQASPPYMLHLGRIWSKRNHE